MGPIILPLILGIIAVPAPEPPAHELANIDRLRRALQQEVYLIDTTGQERVVRILEVGTDAVTIAVVQQSSTLQHDRILAVDRAKDSKLDGTVRGALVGLILGGLIESGVGNGGGRHVLAGAVTYGLVGYLFDRAAASRQKLYRADAAPPEP